MLVIEWACYRRCALATADVNNDGPMDIIIGGSNDVAVFYGRAGWGGYTESLEWSDADWIRMGETYDNPTYYPSYDTEQFGFSVLPL